LAKSASAAGSRDPSTSAASMARDEAPNTSEATEVNLPR